MTQSILDPEKHQRLMADIENISETAHIPVQYIERSMTEFCQPEDVQWIAKFQFHRKEGIAGLALVGQKNAESRMMGMCGALLRNFIDARVIPLNTLMALQKENAVPTPTVLFIPNLFLDSFGKSLSAWQVQVVYDILLSRFTAGKTTVVYVESMDGFRGLYGQVAVDHLTQHYTIL